jgi:hypothetical protein
VPKNGSGAQVVPCQYSGRVRTKENVSVKIGNRLVGVLVAIVGVAVCLAGLLGFLLGILRNTLPWHPEQSVREHYLAVGRSFSEGFTVGFFLCFFLILAVVAAWPRAMRASREDQPVPARRRQPARRHIA